MPLNFKYLKSACFAFNFVVLIVGPTLLAISLRLLLEPQFRHVFYFFQSNDSYVTHILVAIGALMTIVGIFGCIGTIAENSCLLWIFCSSMVLFLVLEITGGTYMYNQLDEFEENLQTNISRVVKNSYGKDVSITMKMDVIQSKWKCCGSTSYKSWSQSDFGKQKPRDDSIFFKEESEEDDDDDFQNLPAFRIPKSCCVDQLSAACVKMSQGISLGPTKALHQEGCSDKLGDSFKNYTRYTILTILIVGIIQILAMMLTVLYAIAIRANKAHWAHTAPRKRRPNSRYLFPAFQQHLKLVDAEENNRITH